MAVIERDGKILVGEGHDEVKKEAFYRPLGGGVDFGEHRQRRGSGARTA